MRSQTLTRRRPFNALGSDVWNGDHDRICNYSESSRVSMLVTKRGLSSGWIRSHPVPEFGAVVV
jgi:hypothetical protein